MIIGPNKNEKVLWCTSCSCWTVHTRDMDEENLIQECAKRCLPDSLIHDEIKIYKCNIHKEHGKKETERPKAK